MLGMRPRPWLKRNVVVVHVVEWVTALLRHVKRNADSIPGYRRRLRPGQRISTAFAGSAVNQIIDKRLSESQQMRWSPMGVHLSTPGANPCAGRSPAAGLCSLVSRVGRE